VSEEIRAVYPSPEQPTAAHLAEWLERHRNADVVEIPLRGDLDLSPAVEREGKGKVQGLVVRARKEVILRADAPGRRPTVRFGYDGKPIEHESEGKDQLAGFDIRSRVVKVQGLRFIVDAMRTDVPIAAVLVRGGSTHPDTPHLVERCEFIQAQPPLEYGRMASLIVDAGATRPSLNLRECCFLGFGNLDTKSRAGQPAELAPSGVDPGGQDAVVRRGPVRIVASDCAFGPHAVTFRLTSDVGQPPGDAP